MVFAVDQIDHVEVFVRDIDASVRWYAEVLGLAEVDRWDPEPVMIGAGGTKLALFRADDVAAAPLASRNRASLRWRVVAWRTTSELFAAAREHLTECGVTFDGPVDHGNSESIYFRDLDGHSLEITCYR